MTTILLATLSSQQFFYLTSTLIHTQTKRKDCLYDTIERINAYSDFNAFMEQCNKTNQLNVSSCFQ